MNPDDYDDRHPLSAAIGILWALLISVPIWATIAALGTFVLSLWVMP